MEPEVQFFNRECSWVEFNARVLHEAFRTDLPLMERLKFISIVSSNFDEFFQVRVAAIKQLMRTAPQTKDASGLSPAALLEQISSRCHQITKVQYETLMSDILPALAKEGFPYLKANQYTPEQKSFTDSLFRHDIFPVLTPMRTDAEQFPHIGNMKLHAAFLLDEMPGVHKKTSVLAPKASHNLLALVPIPDRMERIVWLPSSDGTKPFTLLDDIVLLYGKELFSGYTVKETLLFKVARDADFAVDEDAGSNFIQAMEEVLVKRQSSHPVRLLCNSTSEKILTTLKDKLHIASDDIYEINGILDPSALMPLLSIEEAPKYRYKEWKHFYPASLPEEGTYWNTFRQKDILLHVPYESYEPVIRFISDAAKDENVLAIKMTLYRTGNNSPIVNALKEAAGNGKQVTVFVELKARFDEQRNISWAGELEQAGATVIYGVVKLKVHAKICLIVRRESDGIRRYVHLSTGNYNPETAQQYQDLSIFTSNHEIALDATYFFNVISGYSILQPMRHLLMAPVDLKQRLIELIEREIRQSTKDSPGLIIAKMNSLCHKDIIKRLYKASQAGVRILLNVRGICTLVPGVKGLSENIRVISVIDRYLEHSRIAYFQNSGSEELYLSSADWMERNLDKRIELMFPVIDPTVFKTVKETLLLYFKDTTHSYELFPDGSWEPVSASKDMKETRVQETLYQRYKKFDEKRKSQPRAEFTVRRKN